MGAPRSWDFTKITTFFAAIDKLTKVAKNAGINASDDAPGVILNAPKGDFSSAQVTKYCVESKDLKGAIISSSNFEPLPIAISAERTAVALAHVAHNSVQRTLRMDDDRFSGLPQYLTADTNKNGLGFGTTEDSLFSVYAENVDLINPVSMDGSTVEGDIERHELQPPAHCGTSQPLRVQHSGSLFDGTPARFAG